MGVPPAGEQSFANKEAELSPAVIYAEPHRGQNYSRYNGCSSHYSMKRRRIRPEFSLVVALVLVLNAIALLRAPIDETSAHDRSVPAHPEISQASKRESTFFPVAVWYSGG